MKSPEIIDMHMHTTVSDGTDSPLKILENVKAAGIEHRVRMYDIRHHYATILANNGTPVQVISRLLGHSRTSTTMDVYMEVLPREVIKVTGMIPTLRNTSEPSSKPQEQ